MVFPIWHVKAHKRRSFLKRHSLSLFAGGMVLLWCVLYSRSNPTNHGGSFFGNAIADWTGVLVMVLTTKWFYEVGSEESRKYPKGSLPGILRRHSLSIFLLITGAMLVYAFLKMDATG